MNRNFDVWTRKNKFLIELKNEYRGFLTIRFSFKSQESKQTIFNISIFLQPVAKV